MADDNSILNDEAKVRLLYKKLLDSWNNCNAKDYAGLFTVDGNIIGFDGSQANGRQEIYSHLSGIFNHHKTASYISIVKEVRSLDTIVWALRAVAGMVPPEKSDINPAVNAIQTLVAVKTQDDFQIAIFQNTPASFHGRPELGEQLTKELQNALQNNKMQI